MYLAFTIVISYSLVFVVRILALCAHLCWQTLTTHVLCSTRVNVPTLLISMITAHKHHLIIIFHIVCTFTMLFLVLSIQLRAITLKMTRLFAVEARKLAHITVLLHN